MDSSRGGPLSNFILILPLIVVPALVMLRPADENRGLVSDDLSAADEFPEFDAGSTAEDEYARLFDEPLDRDPIPTTSASARTAAAPAALSRGSNEDRHSIGSSASGQSDQLPHAPDSADSRTKLLQDLSHLGVTRTLWFTPGRSEHIGFAAFLPTQQGIVRYRFEAIAESESAAILDVTRQIKNWQRTRSHAPRS